MGGPRRGVGGVVELERGLCRVQRAEGVAHDRQLVGVGGAEGLLDGARVRAVRDALGVQAHRPDVDAPARLVVALHVVEHLVGVEVRVVVGHRHRFRVEVEHPRAEGADHEVVTLERLVDRRRHVELADDRREVVDVEDVRVVAPVPPDDVARVVVVHVGVNAVARLDAHFELAALVGVERVLVVGDGDLEVALAVGGVLEELARLLREVARRREDVARVARLEAHELAVGHLLARVILGTVLIGELVELHVVDDALGDHDVILGPELERAHERAKRARAVVDEQALVALAVLVVVAHRLGGNADAHLDVRVSEDDDATADRVALGLHPR